MLWGREQQGSSKCYARQSIRTRIDPVGDTESGCELGRWPFAEARLGPINSCALKYFTYVSRLGSGLEAFSHNPSSGSITDAFLRPEGDIYRLH